MNQLKNAYSYETTPWYKIEATSTTIGSCKWCAFFSFKKA